MIEIYWNDLTEEKRTEIMNALGDNGNYDTIPIAVIPIDMYCIIHRSKIFGKKYLAWQNPTWDDDGYFWTSKEVVKDIICNNTSDHPFIFPSKRAAIRHLKSISIPQKCSVIRWRG